jgi:hypothetical protein
MPRFKDAPLGCDQFRLFRFKQDVTDIELEVKTFQFDDAPYYHALSYCWGEKLDGMELIPCNDRALEIGRNLWGALNRLFVDYRAEWHWCDVVSIEQGLDQVAMTEKLQQTPFMDTIFKMADPVLIWLGDASPMEEKAFPYLVDRREKDSQTGVLPIDVDLSSPSDHIWEYWARILMRPWFSRVWVCQEALLNDGNIAFMLGHNSQASWTAFRATWTRTEY